MLRKEKIISPHAHSSYTAGPEGEILRSQEKKFIIRLIARVMRGVRAMPVKQHGYRAAILRKSYDVHTIIVRPRILQILSEPDHGGDSNDATCAVVRVLSLPLHAKACCRPSISTVVSCFRQQPSDFAGLNFCPVTLAGRHPFQSDIFHFFRTKEKYFFWGERGWKHFVTLELIGNLVLNYHYHHELQA